MLFPFLTECYVLDNIYKNAITYELEHALHTS